MKKRWYRRYLIMILILCFILETGFSIEKIQAESERWQVSTGEVSNKMVIPGGMPIGIYMKADGVLVLGTDSLLGKDGLEYSPSERIVKEGDYIVGVNGQTVDSKKTLLRYVEELDGGDVTLKLRRNEEVIEVKVTPVKCEDGTYKLGIWIRDSLQGLGTVTYITEDNQFGALGHGIHDSDTDELLEIATGQVYQTRILRIEKGKKGTPGGMEGMIVYNRYNLLGEVVKNTEVGVFGVLENAEEIAEDLTPMPICSRAEAKTGSATIRCCVTGVVKEYEIEIVKIDYFTREANKGMTIKVVDEELLELTGGIIQGMSGSPILQDGKIVGAVTHVLVNDPTRGYGIFIEDMMK